MVATAISVSLMTVLGRRLLLITSSYICVFSMVALGAVYSIGKTDPRLAMLGERLPIFFVSLFVIGYSVGLGPVTWILFSELVPLRGQGHLAGSICSFNWTCAFGVTVFFESMRESLRFSGLGWIFSTVTFVSAIVVAFFLPETKGKSLDNILLEMPGEDEIPSGYSRTSLSLRLHKGR